jgi:glycine hydroxymethyltransferase
MIASENFVSRGGAGGRGDGVYEQVCRGVSGKRYYGGCEFADVVENLARDRAKQLFGGRSM